MFWGVSTDRKFGKTKKHLVDQARKAMYSLIRKARNYFYLLIYSYTCLIV